VCCLFSREDVVGMLDQLDWLNMLLANRSANHAVNCGAASDVRGVLQLALSLFKFIKEL